MFLLCGGADNVIVDEKDGRAAPPPFLQNYARRSQRQTDGRTPSKRELRKERMAAETATSFLMEFKTAMKGRGFTAIKYGRKGKPSARCFYLDDAEACIVWNSQKMSSQRRINGARVDSIALLEITEVRDPRARAARSRAKKRRRPSDPSVIPPTPALKVVRGADAIPFDVVPETAKCCLSLRCGARQLALQLDSEQNRELIADGIALLVEEALYARNGGAPQLERGATAPERL